MDISRQANLASRYRVQETAITSGVVAADLTHGYIDINGSYRS